MTKPLVILIAFLVLFFASCQPRVALAKGDDNIVQKELRDIQNLINGMINGIRGR